MSPGSRSPPLARTMLRRGVLVLGVFPNRTGRSTGSCRVPEEGASRRSARASACKSLRPEPPARMAFRAAPHPRWRRGAGGRGREWRSRSRAVRAGQNRRHHPDRVARRGRREGLLGAVGTVPPEGVSSAIGARVGTGHGGMGRFGSAAWAAGSGRSPAPRGATGSLSHPGEGLRPQSRSRFGVVPVEGARAKLDGFTLGVRRSQARFSPHLRRRVRPCGAAGDRRARSGSPDAGGQLVARRKEVRVVARIRSRSRANAPSPLTR